MERKTQNKIMLALSRLGSKIFRNNVGTGWVGKISRTKNGGIYIDNPRPLIAGLTKGSSDLIGWTTIEHEGRKFAVFTAIEVKTKTGKPSPEQLQFIEAVTKAGGIAGICRSELDVKKILQKFGVD